MNGCVVWMAFFGATASGLWGQGAPALPSDPQTLVRRAIQHRLDADKTHQPLAYLLRKVDAERDTTKEIIETRDGDVARIVAVNGKAPSADTDAREMERLNNLARHPELQEKRHKSEMRDAEQVSRMMGMLPDAMLYKFEGTVPCGGGECFRMSFAPNPNWTPPDLEAKILRGVAGEVWIDRQAERLTRLDAHFIADVNFGWGVLGRVDKGGSVLLTQADVGNGDWELTGMTVHLGGKALMVKTIEIELKQEMSGFKPVPRNMDYRQAIAMLENPATK
jgi:hypothetical protein